MIPSWPLRNRDDVIELSQDVDGVHKRLDPLPRQSTPFPFGERGGPLGLVLERAGFVGGTGRGAFLEPREGRDDRVAVGGFRRAREEVLLLSQGVVRGERLPQRGRQDARSVEFEKPGEDDDNGTRASAARISRKLTLDDYSLCIERVDHFLSGDCWRVGQRARRD